MIDIKINKDISAYQEKYMGLTLKQAICGGLAIALSVVPYVILPRLGVNDDIVTWVCILLASPPAAIGFFTYNGMTCVQFVKALFKHYCTPAELSYKAFNIYESYLDFYKKLKEKEKMKKNGNKVNKVR